MWGLDEQAWSLQGRRSQREDHKQPGTQEQQLKFEASELLCQSRIFSCFVSQLVRVFAPAKSLTAVPRLVVDWITGRRYMDFTKCLLLSICPPAHEKIALAAQPNQKHARKRILGNVAKLTHHKSTTVLVNLAVIHICLNHT